jgi:hypothetical protein
MNAVSHVSTWWTLQEDTARDSIRLSALGTGPAGEGTTSNRL